jgi:hypothetical protein
MKTEERIVRAGANGTLIGENGEKLTPPDGWAFLPAGDAAITRKVKALSAFWRVQTQIGRRIISKGIWAPATLIDQTRQEVETLRTTDAYKNKLASDRMRRAQQQTQYEQEFNHAVRAFLAFAPRYTEMEQAIAEAVTTHAIPIGSGTVARTAMIPIEERAAKAVIAWMRHRTTAYDSMSIVRIKGERREVRRMLARRSMELLQAYRSGQMPSPACPLQKFLKISGKIETSLLV